MLKDVCFFSEFLFLFFKVFNSELDDFFFRGKVSGEVFLRCLEHDAADDFERQFISRGELFKSVIDLDDLNLTGLALGEECLDVLLKELELGDVVLSVFVHSWFTVLDCFDFGSDGSWFINDFVAAVGASDFFLNIVWLDDFFTFEAFIDNHFFRWECRLCLQIWCYTFCTDRCRGRVV